MIFLQRFSDEEFFERIRLFESFRPKLSENVSAINPTLSSSIVSNSNFSDNLGTLASQPDGGLVDDNRIGGKVVVAGGCSHVTKSAVAKTHIWINFAVMYLLPIVVSISFL